MHRLYLRAAALTALLLIAHGSSLMESENAAFGLGQDTQDFSTLLELRDIAAPSQENLTEGQEDASSSPLADMPVAERAASVDKMKYGPATDVNVDSLAMSEVQKAQDEKPAEVLARVEDDMGPANTDGNTRELTQSDTTIVQMDGALMDLDVTDPEDQFANKLSEADIEEEKMSHADAIKMLIADRDQAVAEWEAAGQAMPAAKKAYEDAITALTEARTAWEEANKLAVSKSAEYAEHKEACDANIALSGQEIVIVKTLMTHIEQIQGAKAKGQATAEDDIQLQRLAETAQLLLDQAKTPTVSKAVSDIATGTGRTHEECSKIYDLLKDLLAKLEDKSCLEKSDQMKEEAQNAQDDATSKHNALQQATSDEAVKKAKKEEAEATYAAKKELKDKLSDAMHEVRKSLGFAKCGVKEEDRLIPGTDIPKPDNWNRDEDFFKNHDFKPTCPACNEQGLESKVEYWRSRAMDCKAKLAPSETHPVPADDWRPNDPDNFKSSRLNNKPKMKTTYENYDWYRVRVNGPMTAANVLKACTDAKMQTPCDAAGYNDGKCTQVPHSGHFSYNNHHSMDRGVCNGAYFYTTHQGNTLQNTGTTHRWATAADKNGDTLCVLPVNYRRAAFDWNGFRFFKMHMTGDVTSSNLRATCEAQKLYTPCGHASYGVNGHCQIVYHAGHMSYNPHLQNAVDKKTGSKFDMSSVPYTYWYANNANKNSVLQNWHNTHRWSLPHERDGQHFCVAPLKPEDPKKVVKVWRGWSFHKVRVTGGMNSDNIADACHNAIPKSEWPNGFPLMPVCDHVSYADGKCVTVNYHGHMSYNPHHDFNDKLLERTYWYAGRAKFGFSLQNIHGTHRWSTKGDLVGDVLCVEVRPQPKREVTMVINGFKFYKRRVTGEVNSANIRKACDDMGTEGGDKFMVPCDHPAYAKQGDCAVVRRRSLHFSHNSHNTDKAGKSFGDLLTGTYWFAGAANQGLSLLNWKGSHRWSGKGDKFGMTWCVLPPKKPPTPAPIAAVWGPGTRKYTFRMVRVPGQMNSQAILYACKAAGLDTPCDHASYADGKCRAILKRGHMSYNPHHSFPKDVIDRTYWYASKNNQGKALQNWRGTHRWSDTGDFFGYTLCIDPVKRMECAKVKPTFSHLGWGFYKVHTRGQVNSDSILAACKEFAECRGKAQEGDDVYLTPCDHPSYRDGNCVTIREKSTHWSHNRYNNIDPKLIDNTYWYAAKANQGWALENWRGTHRWSGKSDIDGAVFCVKPPAPETKTAEWRGYTFVRLQVKGQISNEAIHTTCQLNGLKTPCDHKAYADGKCIALFKSGHLSYNPHHDFPKDFIDRSYWYTGSQMVYSKSSLGHRPLQNWRGTHRWAIIGDMYENAWCLKLKNKADGACAVYGHHCPLAFSFNKWDFFKTRTDGEVNSASIRAACAAVKMMVPCGHPSYADGNCVNVRKQSLHWSYNKHVPAEIRAKLDHTYWYAGSANNQKALENWKGTHRWSGKGDRFGPVYCVKPPKPPSSQTFTWKNHKFVRVQVPGQMSSSAILEACKKAGEKAGKNYQVPCDHVSYADGKCTNVLKTGHLSYNQHHTMDDIGGGLITDRSYFYCGTANGGKALQNWRNTHRWSVVGDQYENTLCIAEPSDETKCATFGNKCDKLFSLNGWAFYKTRTKGRVTAASIREACAEVSKNSGMNLMVPCGHIAYADGHCVNVQKRSSHLSYNPHNQAWLSTKSAAEQARIKKGLRSTYWYSGSHHSGALENWTQQNGGETHRWATAGDKDGMTFCVLPPKAPSPAQTIVWKGYTFAKVQVPGQMSSAAIHAACTKAGMKTPCNHKSYADGKCINVLKSGHLSYNNHHDMDANNEGSKFIDRTYTYCGKANNGEALQNWRNTHRWSRKGDQYGSALCVKSEPYPCAKEGGAGKCDSSFVVHGWKFFRTRTKGLVTSESIREACKNVGLQPVCDHISYSDGHCVNVRKESGHWSHNRYLGDRFKTLAKDLDNTYWYAGNANQGKALENWKGTHRWTEAGDLDGMIFCVQKPPVPPAQVLKWKHWKFVKVRVPGQITSAKIHQVCSAAGYKTPCDHTSYADGKCVGIIRGKHLSHSQHHDIATTFMSRTYTYCGGANGGKALMNWHRYGTQWSHRWSATGDVDENALCLAGYNAPTCAAFGSACPVDRSKSYFPTDWNVVFGYRFFLTRTDGPVTSQSITAACKKLNMLVPCDHTAYGANGGDCVNVRKYGHWSHNQYNQGSGGRLVKAVDLDHTYWYAGKANGDKALENTGSSHRWTDQSDKDGMTFCVLPPPVPSSTPYTYGGHTYVKVQVDGQMSSEAILKACSARGFKVPCDHPSYNDGKCTVVNPKGHMSHNNYHNFDRQKIDMTYWYCGRSNGGRALQNYNGSHRWSTIGDKFGDTWCLVR